MIIIIFRAFLGNYFYEMDDIKAGTSSNEVKFAESWHYLVIYHNDTKYQSRMQLSDRL